MNRLPLGLLPLGLGLALTFASCGKDDEPERKLRDSEAPVWLAAASDHTCAIRSDRTLWCWGANEHGQLGDGSTTARERPGQVGTDGDWLAIDTSASHSCGLRSDGTLWCWGANDHSQLGASAGEPRLTPAVAGEKRWQVIAVAADNTCAIDFDGALSCWGSGLIDGPPDASHWAAISLTGGHACGIREDGRRECWGENNWGQLGDDQLREGWTYVSAGGADQYGYTCGGREDGSLWCFGYNTIGQLGLGPDQPGVTGGRLEGTNWTWVASGRPAQSAYFAHTCGLKQAGTLWCWGFNEYGQLGNDRHALDARIPGQVGSDDNWTTVKAGNTHTCGGKDDGSIWCWGANENGQLGVPGPSQVPRQVDFDR